MTTEPPDAIPALRRMQTPRSRVRVPVLRSRERACNARCVARTARIRSHSSSHRARNRCGVTGRRLRIANTGCTRVRRPTGRAGSATCACTHAGANGCGPTSRTGSRIRRRARVWRSARGAANAARGAVGRGPTRRGRTRTPPPRAGRGECTRSALRCRAV